MWGTITHRNVVLVLKLVLFLLGLRALALHLRVLCARRYGRSAIHFREREGESAYVARNDMARNDVAEYVVVHRSKVILAARVSRDRMVSEERDGHSSLAQTRREEAK